MKSAKGALGGLYSWFLEPPGWWQRAVPAFLWMALIFALSSVPGDEYPKVRYRDADKIVHLLLYTPLGVLLGRWLRVRGSLPGPLVAIAVGILFGASDEWHQAYVPYRSSSAADLLADSIGVVLGVIMWCSLTAQARLQVQQQQESA